MSAAEVIEQIKAMPLEEKKQVLNYLNRDLGEETALFDEFSLLGADADGANVSHTAAAQAEVISRERL